MGVLFFDFLLLIQINVLIMDSKWPGCLDCFSVTLHCGAGLYYRDLWSETVMRTITGWEDGMLRGSPDPGTFRQVTLPS